MTWEYDFSELPNDYSRSAKSRKASQIRTASNRAASASFGRFADPWECQNVRKNTLKRLQRKTNRFMLTPN